MQGVNGIIKRLIDMIFSATALIMLSPLMLIIAAVIRLTSPRQSNFSSRNASAEQESGSTSINFRSMLIDAEKKVGHIWAKNR